MKDKHLITIEPQALAPLITDGMLSLTNKDISAVILRNAGTATVDLFLGQYTLDPKETLSLNVTEDNAALRVTGIPVQFDISTGSVKKLQIVVLNKLQC